MRVNWVYYGLLPSGWFHDISAPGWAVGGYLMRRIVSSLDAGELLFMSNQPVVRLQSLRRSAPVQGGLVVTGRPGWFVGSGFRQTPDKRRRTGFSSGCGSMITWHGQIVCPRHNIAKQ